MRMFTKIGVTLASGAFPVLLWAGAASAQTDTTQSQSQSSTTQSQSQSQSQSASTIQQSPTNPQTTNTGGTLARTGAEDVLPLAAGGVVLAGAVAYFGVRRRSVS